MREATRAPVYAAAYHGLCDKARGLGYALAIHGSVTEDLDLVAVPWVVGAASADELAKALRDHIGACFDHAVYHESGREDRDSPVWDPKPHGRVACNLYMGYGAKVDLSVTPRIEEQEEQA